MNKVQIIPPVLQKKTTVKVTYYTNDPKETDDTPNITASNTKVREGIIGVSRDLLKSGWPHGSKVYIKGHGMYTIEDTMNKRFTNSIDIFTFSKQHAREKGTYKTEMFLLE